MAPYRPRRHQHQDRQNQVRVEQHSGRRLAHRRLLDHHQDAGAGKRAGQRHQGGRLESAARADGEHDPDEADEGREPALPRAALAQHRHREQRDEQRHREAHGREVGQRQARDCIERGEPREQPEQRTHDVHLQVSGAQAGGAAGDRNREHEHQADRAAEEGHLQRVVALAHALADRVHQHQAQRAEQYPACAAGVRCQACPESFPGRDQERRAGHRPTRCIGLRRAMRHQPTRRINTCASTPSSRSTVTKVPE